jgi:hypothetical protein
MDCAAHPDQVSAGPCAVCFKNLCEACATFERDGSLCCERCGRIAEADHDDLSSGLLALVAVGYLATLVIGTAVLRARPLVGGLAAVVAIALGRTLQLVVKGPVVSRRFPPAKHT